MRSVCLLSRRFRSPDRLQRRTLLTLAIETSCDDTSVAILERTTKNSACLHFHEKITSNNASYRGIHPIIAHESHQKNLAALINRALLKLPLASSYGTTDSKINDPSRTIYLAKTNQEEELARRKPDFVTVTRGPGMRANLITGVDTAKGLAVAWQIPLLGVNHMQAHALTPRLVSALGTAWEDAHERAHSPAFPFLTLLVSGGHTMLVHSKSLCEHEILANTSDIAVGDMIDKTARDILPADLLGEAEGVMFGPLLEKFAFPAGESQFTYQQSTINRQGVSPAWSIAPPYRNLTPVQAKTYNSLFSFSGIGSSVKRIAESNPHMLNAERQLLAREIMRIAFEHLASRIIVFLESNPTSIFQSLVVSGGVASNQYLKHTLKKSLQAKGHGQMSLVFPPPKFCTDNAAMIAWTGMEMWDAGYRTRIEAMAVRKWSIDPRAVDGGILGIDGWEELGIDKEAP